MRRRFSAVQKEPDRFDRYIWQFVGGKPQEVIAPRKRAVPASTTESDAMSKDLKKRGFRFVGSTICYAFMQASGMVNDHTVDCFRSRRNDRARPTGVRSRRDIRARRASPCCPLDNRRASGHVS